MQEEKGFVDIAKWLNIQSFFFFFFFVELLSKGKAVLNI